MAILPHKEGTTMKGVLSASDRVVSTPSCVPCLRGGGEGVKDPDRFDRAPFFVPAVIIVGDGSETFFWEAR
jgi:hypothetical protein